MIVIQINNSRVSFICTGASWKVSSSLQTMSTDEDEELYGPAGGSEDATLPKVVINKMMKEQIPNVRISNDARELM